MRAGEDAMDFLRGRRTDRKLVASPSDGGRLERSSVKAKEGQAFVYTRDNRSIPPSRGEPLLAGETHMGHLSRSFPAPVGGEAVVDVAQCPGDRQRSMVVRPCRGDGEARTERPERKG